MTYIGDEHGIDAQELVGMLSDALRRALVGGRSAAPTRDEDATEVLRELVAAHDAVEEGTVSFDLSNEVVTRLEAATANARALLSRLAAESPEDQL